MSLFRCNIDRAMVNTGTKNKPFISARKETKEFYCGPVKYCTVIVEKIMDDIGDKDRPYFVKVFESVTVRFLSVRLRSKEQSWKFKNYKS